MTSGWTAEEFGAVAVAFERNFTERGERGAAFAAYRDRFYASLLGDVDGVRVLRTGDGRAENRGRASRRAR